MDRINIYYSAQDEYVNKIRDFIEFIKKETLAINMERIDKIDDVQDINEYKVGIRLEKVK